MNQNFVTYEQAQALKELGFDERDIIKIVGSTAEQGVFTNDAPLTQQALHFFREKFELFGCVRTDYTFGREAWYHFYDIRYVENGLLELETSGSCETYEQAANELINKLIEIARKINDTNHL